MAQAQRRREIEENFRAFEGLLSTLLPDRAGQFALLRHRTLVEVFPTAIEALMEGQERFADGLFSVQRVTDRPLDLGFLSYASGDRDAI
jgi:hypothetical protein